MTLPNRETSTSMMLGVSLMLTLGLSMTATRCDQTGGAYVEPAPELLATDGAPIARAGARWLIEQCAAVVRAKYCNTHAGDEALGVHVAAPYAKVTQN